MDYAERLPPEPLQPLVKLVWTLSCGGEADARLQQVGTPDGCIEIIHRLRGRSWSGDEQPQAFVVGLNTRPMPFEVSGDAAFVALRLWPWAWNAVATVKSPGLVDRWLALGEAASQFRPPADMDEALRAFDPRLGQESSALATAILASATVAELAERSGRPQRWLQRWFEREVGVPPGTYLRVLRFQETLTAMQQAPSSLADHAAAQGYADQAHMTREFRRLAGLPARRARQKASGPFL